MQAASDEVSSVAEDITRKEVAEITPSIVRRAVMEYLELQAQKSAPDAGTDGMMDLMQALDEPDNGGGNG